MLKYSVRLFNWMRHFRQFMLRWPLTTQKLHKLQSHRDKRTLGYTLVVPHRVCEWLMSFKTYDRVCRFVSYQYNQTCTKMLISILATMAAKQTLPTVMLSSFNSHARIEWKKKLIQPNIQAATKVCVFFSLFFSFDNNEKRADLSFNFIFPIRKYT